MGKRTDEHRPSEMDPAQYEQVGDADFHHEDGYGWFDYKLIKELQNSDTVDYTWIGEYSKNGASSCDHCGHHIRYAQFFLHKPTGGLIQVGDICARRFGFDSRSEMEQKQARERHARISKQRKWMEASEDNRTASHFLEGVYEGTPRISNEGIRSFMLDLRSKLIRYGDLSEKQVAAVLKIKNKQEEFKARDAEDSSPVVEGKITVEGEIKTLDWRPGFRDMVLKMLVCDDRGFKVWGTVPAKLQAFDVAKGDKIRFDAEVEQSKDDESFGFFKRPRNAELIQRVVVNA